MSTCYIHTGTHAPHTCDGCGEAICETCRAKNREKVLCYLCVTRLEPPPEELNPRIAALDEAFPDVSIAGWRGHAAAAWRGGVLGLIVACVIGIGWGLWESLWGGTNLYAWGFAGVPVGLAVGFGAGSRKGWLPIAIGAANGIVLILVRTSTVVYQMAITNPEIRREFRRMMPWDQAGGVLIAALSTFQVPEMVLFALFCIGMTAAVATGFRLRH